MFDRKEGVFRLGRPFPHLLFDGGKFRLGQTRHLLQHLHRKSGLKLLFL